ncbi:MAG: TauD/TfdA family dioxygenase, partial [Myxococcota bacterium]|nr:TauD/TfdA family dioxygenase [Myxococcota bacterium]
QVNPIMGGIKEIPQVVRVEKRAGDSDIFTGRARLIGSYLMNPPKMAFCQNADSGLSFDLVFASLTQAWRGLSEDFQAILADLSVTRSGLSEFGPEAVDPRRFSGQAPSPLIYSDAIYQSVEHPLVHIHRQTGKKSLYVDEAFCRSIEGLGHDESRAILDFLARHCAKPEYGCRIVARPGALVMWDARAVTFTAPMLRKEETRLCYMVTLASEEGFRRVDDPPDDREFNN